MSFYKRQLKMLLEFAQERDEVYYSEKLGVDYVEKKSTFFKMILKDA